MKAIQVKYLAPTNTKPSRWKAFVYGGANVTLSYDYSLGSEENARSAAIALMVQLGWPHKITGSGGLPNGDYVYTIGQ
jgi:hypothetical protein